MLRGRPATRIAWLPSLLLGSIAALALSQQTVAAQTTYHHVHLAASSAEAGVRWYTTYLDCKPWLDRQDGCLMNSTIFAFMTNGSKGGSVGTGVDHIAFSFADAATKMKALESAGVKIISPLRDHKGPFASGFIEDPWGTRIEVLQDARYPGFHHIHLASSDPDAALNWYQNAFGGERRVLRGRWQGLLYGSLWLLASPRQNTVLAPSEGRAIDHLSWEAKDLDAEAAAMKKRGVTFREEPHALVNQRGQRQKTSVLTSPDGVRIDLVQPQA
jgi:catechol 2,3-dioxygenase-like lactoylglutathione lyase family enzyme